MLDGLLRSFRTGLRSGSRVRFAVLRLEGGFFIVPARLYPLNLLGREDDNTAGCPVFGNRRCELGLLVFHGARNYITARPSRLANPLTVTVSYGFASVENKGRLGGGRLQSIPKFLDAHPGYKLGISSLVCLDAKTTKTLQLVFRMPNESRPC